MANITFDEMFRRAVDLNLRYYSAVGKLTTEYIRELVSTMSDIGATSATAAQRAAQPSPATQPKAQMVLEASAGETALGVFLVENSSTQEIKAPVVASAFTDENGRQIKPNLTFDPPIITLRSSEQLLVRVQAQMTTDLEPDIRYFGEFLIPALHGTRVPVVLRRRPTGS